MEMNISRVWKRKIIFQITFPGDMLISGSVDVFFEFNNLDLLKVVEPKHIPQMVVQWWFTMVESKKTS